MSRNIHVAVKALPGSQELVRFLFDLFGTSQAVYWYLSESELSDPAAGLPRQSAVERSSSGRIFSESADLQWRKQKSGWHVTVLADDKISDTVELPGQWETRPAQIKLLGSKANGKWRVPDSARLIEYPQGTAEHPQVEALEIIDAATGMLQYTRFIRLGGNQ